MSADLGCESAATVSLLLPVAGGTKEFLVRASYLEIYNEEIRDLLSKNPQARLELKEHPDRGVYVKDLMQFVVKSVAEIGSVLQVRCFKAAMCCMCRVAALYSSKGQLAAAGTGGVLEKHFCTTYSRVLWEPGTSKG
jgi:hypothetical protein